MQRVFLTGITLVVVVGGLHCGSNGEGGTTYPGAQTLMDPKNCAQCHADHYRDWSMSMHAYSGEDPVVWAINKLGQRETNGALGSLCIGCHSPLALREGASNDGLNLSSLPQTLKGITCFYCHTVDGVQATHNDGLHLAGDNIMRGPLVDPVSTSGHRSGYSRLHDRNQVDSTTLCGSCHDLFAGSLPIERTYIEWQSTVFAQLDGGMTCGQCHMPQSASPRAIAQAPGVPLRRYHDHSVAALDVSLTSSADAKTQTQKIQPQLEVTLASAVCVGQGTAGIDVILENVGAGHDWTSGGAQHRRAWVELVVYAGGQVIYQSGVVPDATPLTKVTDLDRWEIRECLLDASGKETLLPWQAASYEAYMLKGLQTFDQSDPRYYQTHVYRSFPRSVALNVPPDRVTMRVRVQPIAFEILDAVIASGDLDPSLRPNMPTFDAASVEWTASKALPGYTGQGVLYTCVSNTSLNFGADKVPALEPVKCAPQ
jgi:hypothetical protein